MGENQPKWNLNEKYGDVKNLENLKIFKQQWKNYCIVKNLATQTTQVQFAYLENCLDGDGLWVYNLMTEKFTNTEKENPTKLLETFEKRFLPKITSRYSCYLFQHIIQNENESIETYVNRLLSMVKGCNFANMENKMVCNQFIFGLRDEKTRNQLMQHVDEDLTLTSATDIAKIREMHIKNLEMMKKNTVSNDLNEISEENINKVNYRRDKTSKLNVNLLTCKFCGKKHIFGKKNCPAFGKTCNNCKQENHFATCCTNLRNNNDQENKKKKQGTKYIKKVEDRDSETDSDGEDEVYKFEIIRSCKTNKKILRGNILMKHDDNVFKNVMACWDTGASCCVIGEENLLSITKHPKYRKSLTKLKPFYGETVTTIAETVIECLANNKKVYKVIFQIVDGNVEPILSANACQKLNLIHVNSLSTEVNVINSVENQNNIKNPGNVIKQNVEINENERCEAKRIVCEFNDIFEGDGRVSSEAKLNVDQNILPVQESPRRIPLPVKKILQKELNRLEEIDIIEKVEHHTDWISNIVIVKKKDKDKIRICLDPQYPNQAIKRPKYQMPTIDEMLPELTNAKIFSLVDAKNGYWQIPLSKDSMDLTTFWTPFGRYRFKVLPFGINASAEIFQQKLFEIVRGLTGIELIADDILVFGKGNTKEEALKDHNQNLKQLFLKLREANVKINREKMKLAVTEVKFYGHLLTENGIKPDQSKISTITKMSKPTDIPETQKFLGMINYLTKFIPNLSKTSIHLRNMIKSRNYYWNKQENDEFENLKSLIIQVPILKYYSLEEDVIIQTDGSRKGLGAVLLQNQHPVIFASKSLTKTEQNYSQCEIELLAITFACLRFNQYISGRSKVIIETDHISLKNIFNKPIHKCTKRIQRLRLCLQKYDLLIRYIPGKQLLIPDLLSRLPVSEDQSILENDEIVKVLKIIENIKPDDIEEIGNQQIEEIRQETQTDDILQQVIQEINTNWKNKSTNEEVKIYTSIKDHLKIQNGIVLKDDRFVIPTKLRDKYLNNLHYGHEGIQACLQRCRQTIFWPNITKDIQIKIKSCYVCAIHSDNQQKLPMLTHKIPTYPFQVVSMDFCEAEYKNQKRNIMIIVDHYSDYIETIFMKGTTAEDVIQACKTCFSRFGIPQKVITDGAHNFKNKKFIEFSDDWNFIYVNSSPYYPRGNGKAESAVKIIKRIIKKCESSKQCFWKALLEHRNTPNEIGYSPAQRLMSRNIRSVLPRLDKNLKPRSVKDVSNKIKRRRTKSKKYYDKSSKPLNDLKIGTGVMVKLRPEDKLRTFAIVKDQLSSRAYEIDANGKRYIRNRQQLNEFNHVPNNGHQQQSMSDDIPRNSKLPTSNTHIEVYPPLVSNIESQEDQRDVYPNQSRDDNILTEACHNNTISLDENRNVRGHEVNIAAGHNEHGHEVMDEASTSSRHNDKHHGQLQSQCQQQHQPAEVNDTTPKMRRSQRYKKQPEYLKDYEQNYDENP